MSLDASILLGAWLAGALLRFSGDWSALTYVRDPQNAACAFAVCALIGMSLGGVYRIGQRKSRAERTARLVIGVALGNILLLVASYVEPNLQSGRGVLALANLFGISLLLVLGHLIKPYFSFNEFKSRLLVIGPYSSVVEIDKRLRRRSDREQFSIIAYELTDSHEMPEDRAMPRVCIPEGRLAAWCKRHNINEIILAGDPNNTGMPLHYTELLKCKLFGVQVSSILNFFEHKAGHLPANLIDLRWMVHSEGFYYHRGWSVIKRALDIFIILLTLPITLSVALLTAVAIFIESPDAPVLYRQVRVGRNNQSFVMVKFRSMITDAESKKAQWAASDDCRITRVGRWIRRSRLDELPQLWNILKGDMSIVGPRPERPEFVSQLSKRIPFYQERHSLRPGLTGWAQIHAGYADSLDASIRKHEYDLYYIKNVSPFLDLTVIFQTLETVLFGKGAR